ncbi:MAG: DUF805 domain-containing protein [Lachnospiraceae bacterium]|nr:DUF805 domain-containing protein [Lachnospiraceae bacterium]
MTIVEAVKSCFSQYVGFSGRARRSEYWYFSLFELIVSIALSILGAITGSGIFSVLSGIFALATILPGLAVSIRRLHDIGKSGWFVLISLIPVIGTILIIIWACKDSDPGDNQYGPNPKGM